MARRLIPYGRLEDGKYGIVVDDSTGKPLASAVEVFQNLPAVADTANYEGRTVFEITSATLYVFRETPTPLWIPLEGIPADVGAVAGNPPTVPTPQIGSLFWDTDTKVMFVWTGFAWEPIGGLYAAQFVEQRYTGDNVATSFPMGVSVAVPPTYVEVFLDGVRQVVNPGGDFNIVGTNVVFNVPVPAGVEILIRSLVSDTVIQNAQVFRATYTATIGQTTFDVGTSSADPAGVFVFVDGVVLSPGTDYTYQSLDTSIGSISKTSATVARANTTVAHSLSVGATVTIGGAQESDYNQAFVVSNVPSPTQFDFNVPAPTPVSATPDPVLFYTPAYVNDQVVLTTPATGGENVDIRSLRNVVVAPSGGEANVLGSVGTGESLVAGKAGDILQLKSLQAGPGVSIVNTGNQVQFSINSVVSFEDRVGVNVNYYSVNGSESYVGVRNTSFPVTVDLSGIPNNTSQSGRRIIIQDESGGASVNNITIIAPGSLIDGAPSAVVINQNYGAVSMVKDGSNWYVTSRKP